MENVKIFILCAGEGRRLRPHTENQPKCLVSYRGKPLLQYQLEVFKQFNLENITLIGGYHSDALPQQYPNETFRRPSRDLPYVPANNVASRHP